MITHSEVQKIANQWGLEDHIIEKDYVMGWLLWGISKHPVLSMAWVLKGGSAIKKCYVDTHRYSQDLDFTVLPNGPWQPDELQAIFSEILSQVSQSSGIIFSTQPPTFEIRPHGESCEGKIYYTGPRGNPSPTAIKLDITHAEDLMRPQVLRYISHPYTDIFSDENQIYCYSFEELFAEKIRALEERGRPGDLYDIIYLFRRSDLNAEPGLIAEVLEFKCDFKGIAVPNLDSVQTAEKLGEISTRWEPMLGKDVGSLPPLADYWDELPAFFAWLNGEEYITELLPINNENAWEPASLSWQRGQGELLEPLRYAAVNHLLVNLGYNNEHRVVEPYSLRLTRAGNILFYAIKVKVREIRAYRLDRIESIAITHDPFKPVFRIEFTPNGRIPVPYTQRRRHYLSSRSERRYTIKCAACGKLFYRERYSTYLNAHKRDQSDVQCYGRYGYLV